MAAIPLIDQICNISEDYLGPAADRFVERQISMHLKKKPAALTPKDIYKLADWIKLSFSLLTNDIAIVEQYTERLLLVADGKWNEAASKKWARK